MQRLNIALLGPPKITLDGKPVKTDRHKAIGLLAYLAVEAKAHSRDTLAAMLWPDYPRTSAFSYLRRTLWELNQMLGKGWVEADRENVSLVRKQGLSVDIDTFTRLMDQKNDPLGALTEAVDLYRGDFLEGLVVADTAPFEEWQTQQCEVFRRELAIALESLVEAYAENGAFEQALPFAQRWLSLDRLNESAYRAVMRQMAGMGDRSGAIRVYQACAKTLKDELDVAPQAETEQLFQEILHGEQMQESPGMEEQAAAMPSPRSGGNLPVPATPFIGRTQEIDQVSSLALNQQVRLLTLVGPGGTGKTRLSIQAAGAIAGSFPDGVWFISLAPVQSAQGIVSAVAAGINFSFYKGEETQRQQLLDYMREKCLLLMLDNFEHLLDGGRDLVTDILGATKGVKLLVTSRERLNLQPEQVFRVPGMSVPDLQTSVGWKHPEEQAKTYSGIQLLVDRARRVRPEFEITSDNLKPVIEICQLVDGSPLGIELAAAWLEVLPVEEIAQEIVRSLDFLESTSADTPERQRSLRMVFDTSWRLLNTEEQQAFRRLCAFRGSFSRQAAQEVSDTSLRTLLSLANKSWLQQNESGRYHLHEVLKQYGMERLKADPAEWRETKKKQAEFFCRFLEQQGKALHTGQQIHALQALKPELDSNIPDTWEWLVSQGRIGELIDRVLLWIFYYWLIRGVSLEFLPLIKAAQKAIQVTDDSHSLLQELILETVATNIEMGLFIMDDHPKERLEKLWARVHESALQDALGFWYIVLVTTYGNVLNFQEGSRRLWDIVQNVDKLTDQWEVGNCFLLGAWFADYNKTGSREKYLLDALDIFKKLGVLKEQGSTLQSLGNIAGARMEYEQAIKYTLAAQAFYQQVGDTQGIDSTWTNLGEYYIFLGKIDQAFHAFEELRHYSEKMGNRRLLGTDLSWESLQMARYGKLELALELRQRSLEIANEVGNQHDAAWATWELGEIYRLMGKVDLARKYYQEAFPAFESMQEFIGLGFYHRGLGDIAAMEGNWMEAKEQYQKSLAYHEKEGRGNREWGLALTNARLGTILAQMGQLEEARQYLIASLALAINWKTPDLKTLPLLGIASWLAASGSTAQAVELAACVASKPTTWNEVKEQARRIVENAKGDLPLDEVKHWEEIGEAMKVDEACQRYGEEGSF